MTEVIKRDELIDAITYSFFQGLMLGVINARYYWQCPSAEVNKVVERILDIIDKGESEKLKSAAYWKRLDVERYHDSEIEEYLNKGAEEGGRATSNDERSCRQAEYRSLLKKFLDAKEKFGEKPSYLTQEDSI